MVLSCQLIAFCTIDGNQDQRHSSCQDQAWQEALHQEGIVYKQPLTFSSRENWRIHETMAQVIQTHDYKLGCYDRGPVRHKQCDLWVWAIALHGRDTRPF